LRISDLHGRLHVVLGAGNTVYIYRLRSLWFDYLTEVAVQWPIRWQGPWSEPDPRILDLLRQIQDAVRR
jgi:hypothetical protein